MFVAGYFVYEWGYCLEPVLHGLLDRHMPSGPLVWLGIFRERKEVVAENYGVSNTLHVECPPLELECSRAQFISNVTRIHDYIAAGDTYQVNYTVRGRFGYNGDTSCLYDFLRTRQPVEYGAFVSHDDRRILSFSPELFFSRDGSRIVTKPMKGTSRRGNSREEDERIRRFLRNDVKNRAENVMIVDLLRNDFGRICEMGSVEVPALFTVEEYETLFQMTSTVSGILGRDVGWLDIFRAIYPCGSITGAPKIRTMEIIAGLESSPRGVYTGAIGYFGPGNEAMFNVAIRTLVIDGSEGEMGIGSGITIGSDPVGELEETMLKARFFSSDVRCR
jgi:para-aminobenzoate synthetase/4-amino-4-deoxychorismate lyase